MKHIKRVITIFFIFIIMAASLVPSFRCSHFVYADSTTDSWESVTTNQELADAFRYYCKSRNLVIEGSVADALTSFTTKSFNTICNTLGIDVTALQAHLKRSTDSNGRVQFLFDQFGVTAFNRIFAEFLQNNNLTVGDEVPQTQVQSGEIFIDPDGNRCEVYILNTTQYNVLKEGNTSYVVNKGTTYRYNGSDLRSLYNNGTTSVTFHLTQNLYWQCTISKRYNSSQMEYEYHLNNVNSGIYSTGIVCWEYNNRVTESGKVAICKLANGKYYLCTLFDIDSMKWPDGYVVMLKEVVEPDTQSNNVYIYSPTTINNNTYTDNRQTVINNEGDVYNYDYDDDDPPINPPSGGGGDDSPTDPDDWGVDLPDLNIDWLLTGKENKFPFNIPFNIILTLSLLNAEPEAPHFEGTVDLGVYQWNYEIDLEQFDPVAEVCRNFEFIAFLIGLMLLTKRLIWG